MKFAVAVLALAVTAPAALAEPRRALMQHSGVCATPPCHEATGPADFSMSYSNQLANVASNGGEAGAAFGAQYNQQMTPAESSCVASCQTEQKAAGAEHHFFDWKGCQAACFPAGTPQEVNIHTAIPPTAAEALAALLVQQAEQQAAMQAQQAAQQTQREDQQAAQQAQQKAQQAQAMAQQAAQQKQKAEQQAAQLAAQQQSR